MSQLRQQEKTKHIMQRAIIRTGAGFPWVGETGNN